MVSEWPLASWSEFFYDLVALQKEVLEKNRETVQDGPGDNHWVVKRNPDTARSSLSTGGLDSSVSKFSVAVIALEQKTNAINVSLRTLST